MTPSFERPIAHRGLHDRASGIVENSLSAFAAAIERGYDIECDVQLSRDGAAMVFHDDDLARLTGRDGRVNEHSAVALDGMTLLGSRAGDTVPTLSAMLHLLDGRALIQIELKQQPTAAATNELAKAVVMHLASYAGPVVLESFDPNLLISARRAGARAPLGIITHAYEQRGRARCRRFAASRSGICCTGRRRASSSSPAEQRRFAYRRSGCFAPSACQ